jgi:hypothetical protein
MARSWRGIHLFEEIGRDGHQTKHAHVAAAGVARGHAPECAAQRAERDAHDLAKRRTRLVLAELELEQEQMRVDMRHDLSLAQHVCALQVMPSALERSNAELAASQPEFAGERLTLTRAHGRPPRASGDRVMALERYQNVDLQDSRLFEELNDGSVSPHT